MTLGEVLKVVSVGGKNRGRRPTPSGTSTLRASKKKYKQAKKPEKMSALASGNSDRRGGVLK